MDGINLFKYNADSLNPKPRTINHVWDSAQTPSCVVLLDSVLAVGVSRSSPREPSHPSPDLPRCTDDALGLKGTTALSP